MSNEELFALKMQLEEAKKATAAADAVLSETKAQVAKIEAIEVEADTSLPLTSDILSQIEDKKNDILGAANELENLYSSAMAVKRGLSDIAEFQAEAASILREIRILDHRGQYEDAFAILEAIKQPIPLLDYGMDLGVQKTALAIYGWEKAVLYAHKGEANIHAGLPALSHDEVMDYAEIASNLDESLRSERAKNYHIDKANGFAFLMYAEEEAQKPHDKQSYAALLEHVQEMELLEDHMSYVTQDRANKLRRAFIDEYNELSYRAFEEKRDFDESLYFFREKGPMEKEKIQHIAFREAVDERQFKLFFLESEALKSTAEQFRIDVRALITDVKDKNDFSAAVLAHYFALRSLDDEKKQILTVELDTMPFDGRVIVIGKAYALGLDEARQSAGLEIIAAAKKKNGDLEQMAEFLLLIRDKLEGDRRKRMEHIITDVIRSPHAKKVCVKSTESALHVLIKEDPENFPKPLGKPIKNKKIKSWDPINKVIYIGLALVAPILIAILLGIFAHSAQSDAKGRLLLAVPFTLALLTVDLAVATRYGRDERGSEVFRRVLGADALWKSVLAMIFFISPSLMPWLHPFCYALALCAGIEALWGVLFYKDRHKISGFLCYLPVLLTEIVSVIMIIVDLMNGWI